ncbi:unnamed protein product [Calicophoron daubneyi]|uniref:Magnesium transporter protein 1 n=1 Tax=Calicophoron daubneyi TaxID=300641 RepID=A0AAV2TPN4_CALDB
MKYLTVFAAFGGVCLWLLSVVLFCDAASYDETLETKVRRLEELSAHHQVVNLNADLYHMLVESHPRNYSVILLLTALSPKRNCRFCHEAHSEFKILAASWRYSKQRTNELFFAVADFDNAYEIFHSLKLETAPAILHFKPKGNVKPSDYMELSRMGLSAEAVSQWIASRTGIKIRVIRPPSYTGTMLLALFMTVGAAALWFRRVNIDCLYNRSLWCLLSLAIIFCAISGQVYNQIRGPPLLHVTPNGGIKNVIYPSSDYQFVAETLIVMALYIASTAGILLINHVDGTGDAGKKKVYLLGGVGLFSVAFSFLLSVFRRKYQGYPYSFFFK